MENEEKTKNQTEEIKPKNNSKFAIIGVVACVIIAFIAIGLNPKSNEEGKDVKQVNASAAKEETITINQAISMDNKVEMTILSNKVVDKIEPPSATGYYTYFDAGEGKKFVDVTANVKNLSDAAVKQNALFSAKSYVDDAEYDCLIVTEKDNGQNLNQYTNVNNVNSQETVKYHIGAKMPEDVIQAGKTVKFVITVNDKKYAYEVSIIDDENQKQEANSSTINLSNQGKEIQKAELLQIDGICELTIADTNIAAKIEPKNPTGIYTYYEADEGKVYFDLIADIKNLRGEAVKQAVVIGKATLIYDGQYEYEFGCAVEKDGGKDFDGYTNIHDINPLETLRYHIMAQVPSEVKDNDKKIDVKLSINGEDYIYHVR